MAREKHDDGTSDVTIVLAGVTCRDCARAMAFTVNADSPTTVTKHSLHRLLYLIGAVEFAPGKWLCYLCSCAYPSVRLKADGERCIQAEIVCEGFNPKELQVLGWGR